MSGFGRKHQARLVQERRKSDRSAGEIRVTLVTMSDRRSVTLADVSRDGAGLRAAPPPTRGRDVQVRVGGHTLFGSVVWRKDDAFGLRFDERLTEEAWRELEEAMRSSAVQTCVPERDVALAALCNKALAET